MEHANCITWLLGWPLLTIIDNYLSELIRIKRGKSKNKLSKGAAFMWFAIWIIVGIILY